MARGRFISTSVAEDDRLSKLSLTAELLYLKTIPHLDRDGMITGKAGALWGKVCPLREELMPEMQKCIDEWITVGLVTRMMTDKGPVLFFPGFLKNNTLLHYDRETPSQFPVPPGYERTGMGLVVEGTEQKRKPTKKPKEAQVPPSSNGNGEEVNDLVNDLVNDVVNEQVLIDSGLSHSRGRVEGEVKVEVKDQVQGEGETHAREPEPLQTAPASPSFSENGYRAEPLPGEYIPGVPLPRQRQAKYNTDHIARQRDKLGLSAALLTQLTDTVLARMNATEIAALDTDMGNDELRLAQEATLALVGLGHKTPEGIGAVFDTWCIHDWRGQKGETPTYRSIIGHAKDMPKKLEGRKAEVPRLSEAERNKLVTRAKNARAAKRTAEQFGGSINPQWDRDIEAAKGLL